MIFSCYASVIKDMGGVFLLKVLIAIKSELLTDLLSSALSQHEIHICRTGTDALSQIASLHPDILLLELMLPGTDGITLLRKAEYKPPIILALTNLVSNYVLTEAAAAGIQDLLLIPCALRCILNHLDALIEKVPSAD